MDRKLGALIVLGLAASPLTSSAQSNGWGALGEMLGGGNKAREEEVYREAYHEAMETRAAEFTVRQAQERANVASAVESAKGLLADWWKAYGLPPAEAVAVANTYRASDEQDAINARAHRVGRKITIDAAIAAYDSYQLLLANQLLIAASQLPE